MDLSITKAPDWIARRAEQWAVVREAIKGEVRKKDLKEIEHYFMTGEILSRNVLSDSSLFTYFPLKSEEGWDFVLEHIIESPFVIEHKLYWTIEGDLIRFGYTPEEELAQWDYFLGSTFKRNFKSRVPIGKNKEYAQFEVDVDRVFTLMFGPRLSYWISGEDDDLPRAYMLRKRYYFDLLSQMDEQDFDGVPGDSRIERLMTRQMNSVLDYQPKFPLTNEQKAVRQGFLDELREVFDGIEGDTKVKRMWQALKKKHGE
ncbi:hypothetical protein [Gilvimarinus sp. 1_MG-2023]|uniref:hypothetical protein n=1 Tax=Gilvimarinus sp. 1_MG-2023 TaxID=3062638 RepID=UPI0026E4668F|nr:hypothetical protein [Gilvimarinus sp. 1_MG-2023]MDO6748471.1 hypothetical protein [Gilvimarinus sp. 1_MG-2023]